MKLIDNVYGFELEGDLAPNSTYSWVHKCLNGEFVFKSYFGPYDHEEDPRSRFGRETETLQHLFKQGLHNYVPELMAFDFQDYGSNGFYWIIMESREGRHLYKGFPIWYEDECFLDGSRKPCDHASGLTLNDYLGEALALIKAACIAVAINSTGVAARDVRPANILVGDQITMLDFDSSNISEHTYTISHIGKGNERYAPPLLELPIGPEYDFFSLGCLFQDFVLSDPFGDGLAGGWGDLSKERCSDAENALMIRQDNYNGVMQLIREDMPELKALGEFLDLDPIRAMQGIARELMSAHFVGMSESQVIKQGYKICGELKGIKAELEGLLNR